MMNLVRPIGRRVAAASRETQARFLSPTLQRSRIPPLGNGTRLDASSLAKRTACHAASLHHSTDRSTFHPPLHYQQASSPMSNSSWITLDPSSDVIHMSHNNMMKTSLFSYRRRRWGQTAPTGRHFSSSRDKTPPNPSEAPSSSPRMKPTKIDPDSSSSGGGRMQGMYDTARKRVSEVEWNTSDLLSVYGIVTLIGLVAVAPFVVRHMRRSDSTYEDIDSEDPIEDLAKMVRTEYIPNGVGGAALVDSLSLGGGVDTLLADLLKSPQIQGAITDLVNQVLQSPKIKTTCQVLLKELLQDLVNDPDTLEQIIHLLQHAIQDEKVKEAAILLVTDVFADKEVLDELVVLVERLGKEKDVQQATQHLLVQSAHNALNDPEILDHSMEFATDVVGDDVVQQTAGEALYKTLSYAVRPTLSVLLSILGVGLIVISIAAFQNFRSSDNASLDRAIMETLEKVGQVARVFSYPLDFLVWCKDAITWLVVLPFRLVTESIEKLIKARNVSVDSLSDLLGWLYSRPSQWVSVLLNACHKHLGRLTSASKQRGNQVLAALSLVEPTQRICALVVEHWDAANVAVGKWAMRTEKSLDVITTPCGQLYERVVSTYFGQNFDVVLAAMNKKWTRANIRFEAAAASAEETFIRNPWNRAIVKLHQANWLPLKGSDAAAFVARGNQLIVKVYIEANGYIERLGLSLERLMQRIIDKDGSAKV